MLWIKSGIENPLKSQVIGRCGGYENPRMTTQNRQKVDAKKVLCGYEVQMNMYIFDFERKSIFNIFICHMLFQDEPTHF